MKLNNLVCVKKKVLKGTILCELVSFFVCFGWWCFLFVYLFILLLFKKKKKLGWGGVVLGCCNFLMVGGGGGGIPLEVIWPALCLNLNLFMTTKHEGQPIWVRSGVNHATF